MKKKTIILALLMLLSFSCVVSASDYLVKYTITKDREYVIFIGDNEMFKVPTKYECGGQISPVGSNKWTKANDLACHPTSILINGKLYVPLREFATALGATVEVVRSNVVRVTPQNQFDLQGQVQRQYTYGHEFMTIYAPEGVEAIVRDNFGYGMVISRKQFPVTLNVEGREYIDITPVPQRPDIDPATVQFTVSVYSD